MPDASTTVPPPQSPSSFPALAHNELKNLILKMSEYVNRLQADKFRLSHLLSQMNGLLIELGYDAQKNDMGRARPSERLDAILEGKARTQQHLSELNLLYDLWKTKLDHFEEVERLYQFILSN